MDDKASKRITILFCISGIYIIYSLIALFFIIPVTEFYWLAPAENYFFFFVGLGLTNLSLGFLFYVFLSLFFGLSVLDFLCAFYIHRGSKKFKKVGFYRSLITYIASILLIIVGLFNIIEIDYYSKYIIVEGIICLVFYGSILYLLILNKRRSAISTVSTGSG